MLRMRHLQSLKPRREDSRLRKILLLLTGGGLAGGLILCVLKWWRRRSVRALPAGEPAGTMRDELIGFIRSIVQDGATGPGDAGVATRGWESQEKFWDKDKWREFYYRVWGKQVTATAVIDFPFADEGRLDDGRPDPSRLNLKGADGSQPDERLLERAYVFEDQRLSAEAAAKKKETRVVLHVHTLVRWVDRDKSAAKRVLKVTSVNIRFAQREAGGKPGAFEQDKGKGSTYSVLPKTDKLRPGLWQELHRTGKGHTMEWNWNDVLNDKKDCLPFAERAERPMGEDTAALYKQVALVIQLGEKLCVKEDGFCEAWSLAAETNKAVRGPVETGMICDVVGVAAPAQAPSLLVPDHALLEMRDFIDIAGGVASDDTPPEDEGQDPARKVAQDDVKKLFEGISNGDIVPTCVLDFPYADKTYQKDKGKSESPADDDDRLLERMYCFFQKGKPEERIVVKAHTLIHWKDRSPKCKERAMFVTAVNIRHATRSTGSRHFNMFDRDGLNLVPVGHGLQKGKWRQIYLEEKKRCEEKGQGFLQEKSSLTWTWGLEANMPRAELRGGKVSETLSSRYRGVREILMKGEAICRDCEPIETFTEMRCEIVGFLTEGDAICPEMQQVEEQCQLVTYPKASPRPAFDPDGPIRLLFLGMNTAGQTTIDVHSESHKIFNEILSVLTHKLIDRISIHSAFSTDPDGFCRLLRLWQPDIVHFGCHGEDEGLHFSFDDFVKGVTLAKAFTTGSGERRVRLVIVNACHSLETADSLRENVDFVIGCDRAVEDKEAIGFSGTLYGELANKQSLEHAFHMATQSEKNRRPYYHLRAKYDPGKMLIFSPPKPASNLPRTYVHITVQQAPMLITTGSEQVDLRWVADELKKALLDKTTSIPNGKSCLTDGKDKLEWRKCLVETSPHVVVWSAKGNAYSLKEDEGMLVPPGPSEEAINMQHVISALCRIPEKLRPKIIFVCHCHGARATAELLSGQGIAGAVVWIESDLLSMPRLLKELVLPVCTSLNLKEDLSNYAQKVFKSEAEARCGLSGEHVGRFWSVPVESCDKRSVSGDLTWRELPTQLFERLQKDELKPLTFDAKRIDALKSDLVKIAGSVDRDSPHLIHVVAGEGLESESAASRCRSVAGQACVKALCDVGSSFKSMFLVESLADVQFLDGVLKKGEGGDRYKISQGMLIWIDLTENSFGLDGLDKLLSALEDLYQAFPLLAGVLTSTQGAHEHAQKIANAKSLPFRLLPCYLEKIPAGLRTAKAESLHEEIRFRFFEVLNPSVKIPSPLKAFERKALWQSIKETLNFEVQEHRPIACLYAGDDSSLLVRICISDVGYLHKLRDEVLLGTFEKSLAKSLNDTKARLPVDLEAGDVIVKADRTYFVERYDSSVLSLQNLTAHQEECISQCGATEDVHVMAPAGAGKTFIALHLVLDTIHAWLGCDSDAASKNKNFVLFVANNKGMALSFARWLHARVKGKGTNRVPAVRRAMSHLHFMFAPFNKGPFSVSIKPDQSNGGQMLLLTEIEGSAPKSYSVVVVDEAHHVYGASGLSTTDRSFVDEHVQNGTRKILLSDISQSDGREIPYPEGLVPVKLTEVVRSTKRIVLGAMSFQLSEGENTNQTRCQHDAVGPHMKALLFPSHDVEEGTVEWYEMYADRVVEALQKFVLSQESGYPGLNVNDRLAVLVPDKDFRDRLKPELERRLERVTLPPILEERQQQHRIVLVTAVEASQRIPDPDCLIGEETTEQQIVFDTVDEFDGLESLIVLVVGLDKAGSATGGEDAVRETRSRFYRAVTRAHMQVVVVNVFVRDGWLEFLGHVRTDEGFEFDDEKKRIRDEAARNAVKGAKKSGEIDEESEDLGAIEDAEGVEGSAWKVLEEDGEAAGDISKMPQEETEAGAGSPAREEVSRDAFFSSVWDNSGCILPGLNLRETPGWSPLEAAETEERGPAIRVLYVTVQQPVPIDEGVEHRMIFNSMYDVLGERLFHRVVLIHSEGFRDPDELDLVRLLRSVQPSILHFGCWGEEGNRFFDDFVKRKDLAGVLRGGSVRVLVVNVCHSLETAESLSKAVDFVIGPGKEMNDQEAISFSGILYGELASECSLEVAFRKATLSSRRRDSYRLLAQEHDPRQMFIFSKSLRKQKSDRAPSPPSRFGNPKMWAEWEAFKALGFVLEFKGQSLEEGLRLRGKEGFPSAEELANYGLEWLKGHWHEGLRVVMSKAALEEIFGAKGITYTHARLWGAQGILVRKAQEIQDAESRQRAVGLAVGHLQRSLDLRRKEGRVNSGRDHMSNTIEECVEALRGVLDAQGSRNESIVDREQIQVHDQIGRLRAIVDRLSYQGTEILSASIAALSEHMQQQSRRKINRLLNGTLSSIVITGDAIRFSPSGARFKPRKAKIFLPIEQELLQKLRKQEVPFCVGAFRWNEGIECWDEIQRIDVSGDMTLDYIGVETESFSLYQAAVV